MAEKFLDVVADIDVVGLLPNVKMPTLIAGVLLFAEEVWRILRR
jgi:hypothetical protein